MKPKITKKQKIMIIDFIKSVAMIKQKRNETLPAILFSEMDSVGQVPYFRAWEVACAHGTLFRHFFEVDYGNEEEWGGVGIDVGEFLNWLESRVNLYLTIKNHRNVKI